MNNNRLTTALLVVIAITLLVNLAFKVRVNCSGNMTGCGQYMAKGCCANKTGNFAINKAKGE